MGESVVTAADPPRGKNQDGVSDGLVVCQLQEWKRLREAKGKLISDVFGFSASFSVHQMFDFSFYPPGGRVARNERGGYLRDMFEQSDSLRHALSSLRLDSPGESVKYWQSTANNRFDELRS